jgi:hypothetical protein
VGDAGVAKLAGLTKLEQLTLSGTQVTDAALGSLTKLPRLKKLAVAFTAVGDEALAAFAAARPDVAVER